MPDPGAMKAHEMNGVSPELRSGKDGMRDRSRRQVHLLFPGVTSMLGILLAVATCSAANGNRSLESFGLHYEVRELRDPRPNRVHILRVDLANPAIRAAVVIGDDPDGEGPAETSLTDPRTLADDPAVLAYINTNPWGSLPDSSTGKMNRKWFEGQPVDIHGLAVSQGITRSPSTNHAACVVVNAAGRAFVGDGPGIDSAAEVMTGFQPVVADGAIAVGQGDVRHPRTAIGVNLEGAQMWLVVVDGRQADYSEGMSLYELGEIMLGLGCWDAVNMDGGGSSIMGLVGQDGLVRVMNRPSGLRFSGSQIRPLPMILTIRKTSNE